MNSVGIGQNTNVLLPQGRILRLMTDAHSSGVAYLCKDASGTTSLASYPIAPGQNTYNVGAFAEDINFLVVCHTGTVQYSTDVLTQADIPSGGSVDPTVPYIWTALQTFRNGMKASGGTTFDPAPTYPTITDDTTGASLDLFFSQGNPNHRRFIMLNTNDTMEMIFADDAVGAAAPIMSVAGDSAGVAGVYLGSGSTVVNVQGSLAVTGLVTAPLGINGQTTGTPVPAGVIGEQLTITTTGTSLTSGLIAIAATLPLTGGVWQIDGVVAFVLGDNATLTMAQGALSDSATMPDAENFAMDVGIICKGGGLPGGQTQGPSLVVPNTLRNASSSININVLAVALFSGDTCTVTARITATRIA